MAVHIPKTVIDPFYRYKRNIAKITTLSRKGGETHIVNIKDLSHDLNRPIAWFSCLSKRLATSSRYDKSQDVTILRGIFTLNQVKISLVSVKILSYVQLVAILKLNLMTRIKYIAERVLQSREYKILRSGLFIEDSQKIHI